MQLHDCEQMTASSPGPASTMLCLHSTPLHGGEGVPAVSATWLRLELLVVALITWQAAARL
jgi:hypothetical protein